MTRPQKHNFGAGPCILPNSVTERAAAAVLDWDGSGLSILEVSHRSPEFVSVVSETESLVRELLEIPPDYSVLFLQGGASSQFSMVPLSFMEGACKEKALYLDSVFFALKAIAEALYYDKVDIVASSKDRNYSYIPKHLKVDNDASYLHITSNNTIEGTQIFDIPEVGVPLVCDMSSDILSRKIDVSKFDLIYAGAQKNLGPAGMTLVICRNSLLDSIVGKLPSMSDYRVHKDNGSLYNTPPVFSIYVAMLNLRWLKELGGIAAIERTSIRKAELLYSAIDRSPIFYGLASLEDRSRMNVTFMCYDSSHEERFMEYATSRGIVGIKGYPTVGGFRASIYNALPLSSVEFLVKVMGHYEKLVELKMKNRSHRAVFG